jgi:hypothetical protein
MLNANKIGGVNKIKKSRCCTELIGTWYSQTVSKSNLNGNAGVGEGSVSAGLYATILPWYLLPHLLNSARPAGSYLRIALGLIISQLANRCVEDQRGEVSQRLHCVALLTQPLSPSRQLLEIYTCVWSTI